MTYIASYLPYIVQGSRKWIQKDAVNFKIIFNGILKHLNDSTDSVWKHLQMHKDSLKKQIYSYQVYAKIGTNKCNAGYVIFPMDQFYSI